MTQKQIDDLIHAPTRLRIMAALVELGPDSEITFPRLQTLLNMTPGNLSSHLKRLEGAAFLLESMPEAGSPDVEIARARCLCNMYG